MGFLENYGNAVNATNLIDDSTHSRCAPLGASGWASRNDLTLGALLARMLVADGTAHDVFESGARNFMEALRTWKPMVEEKARARKWVSEKMPWDIANAKLIYDRVSESSLAYFLDPRCGPCGGAGQDSDRRSCPHCKGTGIADLLMATREREWALDMVSELQEIVRSYTVRAKEKMREE